MNRASLDRESFDCVSWTSTTIHKAVSNIAFIYNNYCVQVLLKELGVLNTTSNTYQQVNDTLHDILQ